MNINDLTIGQAKELAAMFGANAQAEPVAATLNRMIGQQVIIRTFSAGVWFGKLEEKAGNEVILSEARRMYKWWAAESISLSAVALHGIKESESKIVQAVPSVWLEAIEIIPCSVKAATQIAGAANVKAQ
jgi:hypothetical protein